MKLLSIDHVPGQEIEALGMVKGAVVQTKHFGKDFMAALKTLVGGEIVSYTEMPEVLAYGTAVKILGPKEGTVRL